MLSHVLLSTPSGSPLWAPVHSTTFVNIFTSPLSLLSVFNHLECRISFSSFLSWVCKPSSGPEPLPLWNESQTLLASKSQHWWSQSFHYVLLTGFLCSIGWRVIDQTKSPLTGFLLSIGWRIIDQIRLSSNTPGTPTVFLIQQSCIIITFHC